jgi:hypothetical protein
MEAKNFWFPEASVLRFAKESWQQVMSSATSVEMDSSYLEFTRCHRCICSDIVVN